MNSAIAISLFICFVFLAGLFSGSETGMYRMSRLRLRMGVEKKRTSFVVLSRVMRDSPSLLLALLLGTNLSQYIGTSAMTHVFLSRASTADRAEVFTTILTVPILFIFSELIPKNVFFYRADSLMPWVSPLLYGVRQLSTWCGAVPVLRYISNLFGRLLGLESSSKTVIASAQRHHVNAILQDTSEEGLLSSVQSDIMSRIASIPNISIKSVMVPFNKVQTVSVNSGRSELTEKLKASSFTRLPVYEGEDSNIVGFVSIYDALCAGLDFEDLREFIKPVRRLEARTSVIEAIDFMQRENEKMVLVTGGGRERPTGIVTMKDLVEELLGELVEW